MTTERQPLTFEAAMSELVAAIGNIERINSVSVDDIARLVSQRVRLMDAIGNLYVFNGREDANV